MIPSSKWFPTALADRAAWYQNFATNFAALAADLGFLPADVTAVNADNATVQALKLFVLGRYIRVGRYGFSQGGSRRCEQFDTCDAARGSFARCHADKFAGRV